MELTDESRRNIIQYRIQNACDTLAEVASHRQNGYYNTAVNRLYYACFYAATALLISHRIEVKSHDGVRQKLGQYFVLTGQLSSDMGRFYSRLFTKRITGDYDDFITHNAELVDNLYPQAIQFVDEMVGLIKQTDDSILTSVGKKDE